MVFWILGPKVFTSKGRVQIRTRLYRWLFNTNKAALRFLACAELHIIFGVMESSRTSFGNLSGGAGACRTLVIAVREVASIPESPF